MEEREKKEWCHRIIDLFKTEFPDDALDNINSWSVCAELIPHGLNVIKYTQNIKEKINLAYLLNSMAAYLHRTGSFKEVEPIYRQALKIRETQLEQDHPYTNITRNNLDRLLKLMKK